MYWYYYVEGGIAALFVIVLGYLLWQEKRRGG